MQVIIFSQPIHSGKTTSLLQWAATKRSIAGLAMPDIDNVRHLKNITTGERWVIECKNPGATTEPLTAIGKYHFYTSVFDKGNAILEHSLLQQTEWLLIDEVGKLELAGQGFYRGLNAILVQSATQGPAKLLLVVRDSLCSAVIDFFGIRDYSIVNQINQL